MTFVYVYALNDELVENAARIYKRIKFIPLTHDSIFFCDSDESKIIYSHAAAKFQHLMRI